MPIRGWSDAARAKSIAVRKAKAAKRIGQNKAIANQRAYNRRVFGGTRSDKIPRSDYSGKTMLLYHRTTTYRAKNIASSRRWKPHHLQDGFVNLSSGRPTREEHIKGKAVLAVKVPRKKVIREFKPYKDTGYYIVHRKALEGKRVRRVNPAKSAKRRRKKK